MYGLARSWVWVLAAIAALTIGAAKSEDRHPPSEGIPPNKQSVEQSQSRLQIGDKIKLAFYEIVDLSRSKPTGADHAEADGARLRTFYQRMDLSGDYTIDQDGSISVPLLGRFVVEGRSTDEVRADVATSFTSVIGRSANLEVRVLERAPVYVVGPVKSPGAYKHVPGMIVLHAIALAGGLDTGNATTMVDGAREIERLRIRTLEINQLLTRRARLEAERDGETEFTAPVQLADFLVGEPAHTAFITELALFRADRARQQQKREEIALKMELTSRELEALKNKLKQVEAQKGLRIERLNELQKLKDQGWAPSNNVIILRTELSDLEARRQDHLIGVLQAQARLAETDKAAARLTFDETAEVTRNLAELNKELGIAQEVVRSAHAIAAILYRPAAGEHQAYEIVRQSRDGAKTIGAAETSPLLPGDVLRVLSRSVSILPSALPLSIPQSRLTPAQFKGSH